MGTSTGFGGAGGGTPLIPSWLPSGGGTPGGPPSPPPGGPPPGDGNPPPDRSPIRPPRDTERFRGARNDFTRFAGSGGTDNRALGRAVRNYVGTVYGGAGTAARRMGPSQAVGAGLLRFMADARATTTREALRSLNFTQLSDQSLESTFIQLADVLCPPSGTIDEGIARDAFIEMIAEVVEKGITDLDKLTPDQMQTILATFIAKSIEGRLCNDIGTKAVTYPDDVRAAENVQRQLHDFILNGVEDALNSAAALLQNVNIDRVNSLIEKLYVDAFTVLQSLGEEASHS